MAPARQANAIRFAFVLHSVQIGALYAMQEFAEQTNENTIIQQRNTKKVKTIIFRFAQQTLA